jgi:hypothetical protein
MWLASASFCSCIRSRFLSSHTFAFMIAKMMHGGVDPVTNRDIIGTNAFA